jgi:hypothetical protein
MVPTTPFKGELEKVFFQTESSYGVFAGGTWRRFGIMHGASLPDLENMFDPQRVIGEGRNWKIMPKPRAEYKGSISNIWLQNGQFLKFILGSVTTTGASPNYVHQITESSQIPSFTIDCMNYDSALTCKLIRRYLGCKVNRATFEATEQGPLTMSLDDIQAQKMVHNKAGYRGYDASLVEHSVSILQTQPYMFFEGRITIAGVQLARVKSFRLEIQNGNEAPFYITRDTGGTDPNIYSIDEGPRNYRLSMTYDIDDVVLFEECMKAGPLTPAYYGCVVSLEFMRANSATDTIGFTIPPGGIAAFATPGAYIRSNPIQQVETPLIPVELTAEFSSMDMAVYDALSASNYA